MGAYPDIAARVSENVFVTGGNSSLPNMIPRLYKDMRAELVTEMPLKITKVRMANGRHVTQCSALGKAGASLHSLTVS